MRAVLIGWCLTVGTAWAATGQGPGDTDPSGDTDTDTFGDDTDTDIGSDTDTDGTDTDVTDTDDTVDTVDTEPDTTDTDTDTDSGLDGDSAIVEGNSAGDITGEPGGGPCSDGQSAAHGLALAGFLLLAARRARSQLR